MPKDLIKAKGFTLKSKGHAAETMRDRDYAGTIYQPLRSGRI